MGKRLEKPYSRHHVILWTEDWEFLVSHFGRGSPHRAGAAVAIRDIVHSHLKAAKAKIASLSEGQVTPVPVAPEPPDYVNGGIGPFHPIIE